MSASRVRCIAHVDLDAFYAQVEMKLNPAIRGAPVAVVQYNPFGDLTALPPEPPERRVMPPSNNGSIIAVSYPARAFGVKRNMMAGEARKLCPELVVVQVPVAHGKADLTIYRDAGAQVLDVLASQSVAERASIDECYLDVTAAAQALLRTEAALPQAAPTPPEGPGSDAAATAAAAPPPPLAPGSFEGWHVAGGSGASGSEAIETEGGEAGPTAADGAAAWWGRPAAEWAADERLLAAGARVVANLREAVERRLGFTCSAGIAHSKVLAKLGSGLHKPRQQTVVPAAAVAGLLGPLPLGRLRSLGGKFGDAVAQRLSAGLPPGPDGSRPAATVGDLAAVPLPRLVAWLGDDAAQWLYRLARGDDGEEVKPRTLPKSVSCGKTFRGAAALKDLPSARRWLLELAGELGERIAADRRSHRRLPKLLTVSFSAAAPGGRDAGGGRPPPPGWRPAGQAVSRSGAVMRHTAAALTDAAHALLRRWAAGQPKGWALSTLYLTASNFEAAPTGASTLHRFVGPSAAAAAVAATAAAAPAAAAWPSCSDGGGSGGGQLGAPGGGSVEGGASKRPHAGGAGGRDGGQKRRRNGQASITAFVAAAAAPPPPQQQQDTQAAAAACNLEAAAAAAPAAAQTAPAAAPAAEDQEEESMSAEGCAAAAVGAAGRLNPDGGPEGDEETPELPGWPGAQLEVVGSYDEWEDVEEIPSSPPIPDDDTTATAGAAAAAAAAAAAGGFDSGLPSSSSAAAEGAVPSSQAAGSQQVASLRAWLEEPPPPPPQQQQQQQQQQQRPATASANAPGGSGSGGPGASASASAQQQLTLADVDPSVLAELPVEIQRELRAALGGPTSHSGSGARGGASGASGRGGRGGHGGRRGGKAGGGRQTTLFGAWAK